MDQTDYIQTCMLDLQTDDQPAFIDTFCKRCRNRTCVRAQWAGDKFSSRVITQPDRFFHPNLADPNSSRYASLQNFVDVAHAVERIEAADKRGDWVVPDLSPEALVNMEAPPTIILPPAKHVDLPLYPNTPVPPGGIMIDGSQPPSMPPVAPPAPPDWATPQPKIAGVQVVQPGAKIRLGGGDRGQ
jgi:hypothetical protein